MTYRLVGAGSVVAVLAAFAALAACSSNGGTTTPTPGSDAGKPTKDGSSPQSDSGGGDDDAQVIDSAIPPHDATPVIDPDDGGTPAAFPPPAHGALFGAFVGAIPETQTVGESESLYTTAEGLINRRWVIDNRFYDDKTEWVAERTQWDIDHHKIPLVTWEPHGDGDPLTEILAGKHDTWITQEATKAKALGTQILLRWGHEMNGNWYPWSGALGGGGAAGSGGMTAGEKYIAAYKHVHDIFTTVGATNVIWVWCPLVTDVPQESWNHWTNYYPGDAYVDWVGLDAYNWGTSSSCCVWQSFDELVDSLYQDYAGKKPMMLPETASAELGGSKADWINAMRQSLETKYTDIHAVVWFDINKETDWRIDSSAATLDAYRNMALDPYFVP